MKTRITLLVGLLGLLNSVGFAQSRAPAPNVVVKNLYAARKNRATDPFFQTKSRARLNKFFSKELADLIWKDSVNSKAKDEPGALDGDPLYNAQDMKITEFKIKPPIYEANLNLADVTVTFKNFGKEQTILFRVERDKRHVWKIADIFYPDNPADA